MPYTTDELDALIAEAAKGRSGDPFSWAYELAKTYAGSASATAPGITKVFRDVFAMLTSPSPQSK
jgi:hypothetical protein